MTYASEITRAQQKLDACLVIDGIPVLFGTRARVHDGTGVTNPPSAPWTSVAAIVPGSLKLGKRELDMESNFVKPAKVSLQLAMGSGWNKYFELRRAPQSFLGADLSQTGTTIQVVADPLFSDASYAYIERETVLLGSVNSIPTGVTGCTRNCIALPGTNASSHSGSDATALATPGYVTKVTGYPQYMIGRPASLRIFAGESDSAFSDITGLRLSSSPVFNLDTGTIDLTFDDGMSYFARKIATGFRGCALPATSDVSSSNVWQVQFTIPNPYEFSAGSALSHVLVTLPDGPGPFLCKVASVSAGPLYSITINKGAFGQGNGLDAQNNGPVGAETLANATLKRCVVFREYPMEALLKVLLSRLGDGANHATWDVLPGRMMDSSAPPGVGVVEFCMGAGIPAALIDVTTLELLKSRKVPGWTYVLGARGEENLLDFLEDIGYALGGFFFINSAGKLSFRMWTTLHTADTITGTITEDVVDRASPLKSTLDEAGILHTISYQFNPAPWDDTPRDFVTVIHQPIKNLYRDTPNGVTGTRTIKSRASYGPTLDVQGNYEASAGGAASIPGMLNRIFSKRAQGTRRYQLVLPWRYSTLIPGDRVNVTHSLLNAMDGTTVSGLTFDVVGIEYGLNDGTVTIDIDETQPGRLIAPALRVASYAANTPGAGQSTFTLSTNNSTWGGGAFPATYFAVGWTFAVHDRSSAPPFSTTSNMTITGGNSVDTLVCNTNAGFAVVAGDIIQFRDYDNAAATNVNGAQSSAQHDYAFLASDLFYLGAAEDSANKWG